MLKLMGNKHTCISPTMITPTIMSMLRPSWKTAGRIPNLSVLICRYSDEDGWYEANIGNDGLYNIFVFDARKQPKGGYDMLASGGSNAIKQGKDVNAYGFSCNDKKLTLWINGTEVTQIKENNYALREGNVGFGVSSYESLPVIVEFDEFTIDQP